MEPRGIYRERNGWGTQHSARVKYDEHQQLDMAEDRYRARGYQPPFAHVACAPNWFLRERLRARHDQAVEQSIKLLKI